MHTGAHSSSKFTSSATDTAAVADFGKEAKDTEGGEDKSVFELMDRPVDDEERRANDCEVPGPKANDYDVLGPKANDYDVLGPKANDYDVLGPKANDYDVLGPKANDYDVLGPKANDYDAPRPMVSGYDVLRPATLATTRFEEGSIKDEEM